MRHDSDDLAGVLATGRYQSWEPGQGVAIRSTVGEPKFWRHGPLEFVRSITPYGIFGQGLPESEARLRYLARLDERSAHIVERLADLTRQHPGQQLVVLCFDDVAAGVPCHRRWFADWMLERHGLDVPELAQPPAGVVDVGQLRLPF